MLLHVLCAQFVSRDYCHSYSADKKRPKEKLQLAVGLELHPELQTVCRAFPQDPIHIPHTTNEELDPHPEDSTCSRVCPVCLPLEAIGCPLKQYVFTETDKPSARQTWGFSWYMLWIMDSPVLP